MNGQNGQNAGGYNPNMQQQGMQQNQGMPQGQPGMQQGMPQNQMQGQMNPGMNPQQGGMQPGMNPNMGGMPQPGPQGFQGQPQGQMPPQGQPQFQAQQGGAGDMAFSDDYVEVVPELREGSYDFEIGFDKTVTDTGKQEHNKNKTYRSIVYKFKVVSPGPYEGNLITKRFSAEYTAELRKIFDSCGVPFDSIPNAAGRREGFQPRAIDGKIISAEVYLRQNQYVDLRKFKPLAAQNPHMGAPAQNPGQGFQPQPQPQNVAPQGNAVQGQPPQGQMNQPQGQMQGQPQQNMAPQGQQGTYQPPQGGGWGGQQ